MTLMTMTMLKLTKYLLTNFIVICEKFKKVKITYNIALCFKNVGKELIYLGYIVVMYVCRNV